MNRSHYFNYIEEKLEVLAYRIAKRGKINILDLNIYKQNVEGIDLVDAKNKIIAQVSSTFTK